MYAAVAVIELLNALNISELSEMYGILTDPIILGIVIFMFAVESFSDKISGFDSIWDTVDTFLRVQASALMAAGAVSQIGESFQISAVLIDSRTVAWGSHAKEAGGHVMINASPEPVSIWIASFLEDVFVLMGLLLAMLKPTIFLVILGFFFSLRDEVCPEILARLQSFNRQVSRTGRPCRPRGRLTYWF